MPRVKGSKRTQGIEITRQSMATGKVRTRVLNVTEVELNLWMMGTPIQLAMPQLTPDEREFLMTGITPDEWNTVFASLGTNSINAPLTNRIMGSWEE